MFIAKIIYLGKEMQKSELGGGFSKIDMKFTYESVISLCDSYNSENIRYQIIQIHPFFNFEEYRQWKAEVAKKRINAEKLVLEYFPFFSNQEKIAEKNKTLNEEYLESVDSYIKYIKSLMSGASAIVINLEEKKETLQKLLGFFYESNNKDCPALIINSDNLGLENLISNSNLQKAFSYLTVHLCSKFSSEKKQDI